MINGAPISATGRVAVDSGVSAPVVFKDGFGYSATGALCVNTSNAAIGSWLGGLAYAINGRLRAVDIQDTVIPAAANIDWGVGLPMLRSTSELICTTTAPVAQWSHGWPQAANGAVCISLGAPVVNAFTEGFDTGFD